MSMSDWEKKEVELAKIIEVKDLKEGEFDMDEEDDDNEQFHFLLIFIIFVHTLKLLIV